MMRTQLVISLGLLAACETPPMSLRFRLTSGPSQQCISLEGKEATSCSEIEMLCKGVLGIRIVPPDEPEIPYVTVCKELSGAQDTLCSIAGVDLPLPAKPIPRQILEVQMAVFPSTAITRVDKEGNLECPAVQFDANNLPVAATDCGDPDPSVCPRPAVGGRAYYYPGDSETVVQLGCTELSLLNGEKCVAASRTEVIASVNEFGTLVQVDTLIANRLTVSIGEPVPSTPGNHVLPPSNTRVLPRSESPTPTWRDEVLDLTLTNSYCIEVLEDTAMATRTLTCRPLVAPSPDRIDAVGIHLTPFDLDKILRALNALPEGDGSATFPSEGLTLGIVLNQSFGPVSGANINATCGMDCTSPTVKYLSADGSRFNTTGGTTSKGIFVSTDAPYGTLFSWSPQVQPSYGGRVQGKVTIVIIQEPGVGNL